MKENQPRLDDNAHLRRRAEEMLREKADQSPQDLAALSSEEIQEILHELRVHQIELEMQNEELRRTQFELKTSRERYFNLYDLALVGYVTLSEQGLILEANLTAAALLDVARSTLVNQPLSRFILKEDQDIYYLHRKHLFESGEPQGCDLRMLKEDGTRFWAHLAATAAQDGEGALVYRAVISDITVRKQAEEALRLSEERYRTVADYTYDWEYWQAEDGSILYMSPSCERITGYRADEFVAKPGLLDEITHPDDTSLFEQHLSRVQQNGDESNEHEAEFRILRKDGAVRWIGHIYQLIRKEDGTNLGRRVSNRDITERKQAQDALAAQRQTYEQILEQSLAGYWDWDIPTGDEYLSPTFKQMFGYEDHEIENRAESWQKLIFAEDLPSVYEKYYQHTESKGEIPFYNEVRYHHKNGSTVWVIYTIKVIEWDDDRKAKRMIGCHIDITARKLAEEVLAESEEQFRTLSSFAPVGIYMTKPDGTCLYTNSAWQKMAGLSEEEALGHGWVNGIHPDDREMVMTNWQKMVESQGGWGLEYRFQNRAGKTTIVFGVATAQKDASGKIIGYVGVNTDITERKRAELFSKNLVTMNPVSIQVLDSNGFTLEVNPAFKLLFGSVPPADYSIFNDPQLVQKGIGEIFDQLRNGEVVHFPDVSFNPHDSIPELPDVPNWVRTIGFPIGSDNDKPERIVLMQENFTEQKNAELTLRESEYKFRQTFDVSPVGIVMVGLDTRFIQCNFAFAQSLGYETQEMVGKRIDDVTLPEDTPIGKAEMAAIRKGEIGKSQVQKRYLRKDGQVIWAEVTISLIRDSNGQALYFLAIIQNITERKLAEQKNNEQLAELRRWNNATLGREDRIMELKREVNKLLAEAGKPPHYASVAEEAHG